MFDLTFFKERYVASFHAITLMCHYRPDVFYSFAKEIYPSNFIPSPCHRFVRLLELNGQLLRNYTQNIDGLFEQVGVERVLNCHGTSLVLRLVLPPIRCRIIRQRVVLDVSRPVPRLGDRGRRICAAGTAVSPLSRYGGGPPRRGTKTNQTAPGKVEG